MIAKELVINSKPSLSDLIAINKLLEDEMEIFADGSFFNWDIFENAFKNECLI